MNLALLALRLVVGLTLAAHGSQKLFGWFGGHGIEGTAAGYERLGLRPGRVNALLAGLAECIGGLLLVLGLVTPLGAAALIGVMTVAVVTVHLRNGFFVSNNGFEFNLVMVAAAFAVAGAGPGSWSLDRALDIHLSGTGWALGALAVGILSGLEVIVSGRLISSRGAGRSQAHAA
jgi:putative oxidoreductase